MVQRPDQRFVPVAPGMVPGSRSGAAETATTLQASGIPPIVPGLLTASALKTGPGITTLVSFALAGRVWGVQLSGTMASSNTYANQVNNVVYTVQTASGLTLAALELVVITQSQIIAGQAPPLVFGLNVAAGDSVQLNVNGGTFVTNATQRASAIVYYTIP